jgi:hypothetical protein
MSYIIDHWLAITAIVVSATVVSALGTMTAERYILCLIVGRSLTDASFASAAKRFLEALVT